MISGLLGGKILSYNHRYNILLLGTALFFIFLAGCTQSISSSDANNGLAIISLSPDLDRIGGNTLITISMLIENVGERENVGGTAELVGLDNWKITDRMKDVDSLEEADPENNIKGQQQLIEWNLISPINPFDQKYDFSVKLSYFYESRSNILLKAVGLDYFKTLTKDEQSKIDQGIVSISTTDGPMQISAKTQGAFLSQSPNLPVEIGIQNVGTGRAYFKPLSKENLDKVDLQVTVDGKTLSCGSSTVKLANGKTGRVICYLGTTGVTSLKTFSIDLNVGYIYLIEKSSSITVLKSLEPESQTETSQIPA